MREAKLLGALKIDIDAIQVGERLRPHSDAAVISLMASIEEIGLQQDIHVRKVRHKDNRLFLISGGHRIEAFRRLKRQKIPCKVWDCTDDWATLAEIDDNLAHNELEPLDLALFMAERKVVYERLYPEVTAAAFKGNQHTGNLVGDIMSFTRSVSEQKDISQRHVERLVAVGQALDKDTVSKLRASCGATGRKLALADLQAFAKISEPDAREKAISSFCETPSHPTLRAAIKLSVSPKTAAPKDPNEEAFKALSAAWERAPKPAQRRFVKEMNAPLFAMLKELDEGLAE